MSCLPRIKHFSHGHVLEITTTDHVGKTSLCAACNRRPDIAITATIPASSYIYACCPCDFFLHMPCSQLPKQPGPPSRPPAPNNMTMNSTPAASPTMLVNRNPSKPPPGLKEKLPQLVGGAVVVGVASGVTSYGVKKGLDECFGHADRGIGAPSVGNSGGHIPSHDIGGGSSGVSTGSGGDGGIGASTGGGDGVSGVGGSGSSGVSVGSVSGDGDDYTVINEDGSAYLGSDFGGTSGMVMGGGVGDYGSSYDVIQGGVGGGDNGVSDYIDGGSSLIEGIMGFFLS